MIKTIEENQHSVRTDDMKGKDYKVEINDDSNVNIDESLNGSKVLKLTHEGEVFAVEKEAWKNYFVKLLWIIMETRCDCCGQ